MSDEDTSARRGPRKRLEGTYYQRNREKILARRRQRYAEDKEYRERNIRSSIESQRKRRSLKIQSLTGEEEAFRISEFAEMVGVSKTDINNWALRGAIPETPYRTEAGTRLYTKAMADILREAVRSIGRPSEGCDKDELRVAVLLAWRAAGVAC